MKKFVASLISIIAISACTSGETDGVSQAFHEYKSAILERKGQVAAGLVTKETIEEYQRYVDWALSADRDVLEALSFIRRFQVLLLRHRIPAETLREMDGRAVFAHAVDKDWIGKNEVIRTKLGKVDVASNRATAEILLDGKSAPSRFQFLKEDGRWKFDLIQTIHASNQVLKATAKNQEMTENDFIYSILETLGGRRVDEAIWDPLQKGKPDSEATGRPRGRAETKGALSPSPPDSKSQGR